MVTAIAIGGQPVKVGVVPSFQSNGSSSYRVTVDQSGPTTYWHQMAVALAGHVVNNQQGRSDESCRDDIRQALIFAATIISTGRAPEGHEGPLTSDSLISTASRFAACVLDANRLALEELTQKLVATQGKHWIYERDLRELPILPFDRIISIREGEPSDAE